MDAFLIFARFVHFASVLSLAGVFAFLLFVAKPALAMTSAPDENESALRRRLLTLFWPSLVIAASSGVVWVMLVAQNMSGRPLSEILLNTSIIATVLTRTQFGHDWLLRAVVAFALIVAVAVREIFFGARAPLWLDRAILAVGGVFVAAIAWAGHANGESGWAGSVQLASDAVHLLAAGAWLGGLGPLALLFFEARRNGAWLVAARAATLRFSTLGVASVGTLLATGSLNAWFLVGGFPALTSTVYGRLLFAKIILFVAMVCVAAVNRLRLTPRLSNAAGTTETCSATLQRLQWNTVIELGVGLVVLALVGALGVTPPAVHPLHHHH